MRQNEERFVYLKPPPSTHLEGGDVLRGGEEGDVGGQVHNGYKARLGARDQVHLSTESVIIQQLIFIHHNAAPPEPIKSPSRP